MFQGIFIALVALLTFLTHPNLAGAAEASCTLENTDGLPAQTQRLCQLQCALQKQTGTNFSAVSPSPEACSAARDEIEKQTSHRLWSVMAGCGAGAWGALLENVINLLAPEDFRKFVAECSKDVSCRRNLARQIETYRARGSDGEYRIKDDELDRITARLDFNDLLTRSRHNQGATMDSCQRELGNVTRRLSSEFALAETPEDTAFVQQKRWDQIAAFDADCPRLLKLVHPGQHQNPRAGEALAQAGRQSLQVSRAMGTAIQKWFQDLGIAYECYDGRTRAELLCHAIGGVVLDPLAVGGGGVFAAKALARAGTGALPRIGARFSRLPMTAENIARVEPLALRKAGQTESFVVKFQDESRAIFKPCNARDALSNCRGEVLAYQMDQRLGLNLVPETIERNVVINGETRRGSMQRWAEDVRPGASIRANPKPGEMDKQSFFDYVIRNIDRHQNNYLVAGNGQVVSIDHGVAFRDVSVTNARRGGAFDEAAQNYLKTEDGRKTLQTMRAWNLKETRAWLNQYLNPSQTENTMRRIEFLRRYDPDKPNPGAAPTGAVRERTLKEILRDHD